MAYRGRHERKKRREGTLGLARWRGEGEHVYFDRCWVWQHVRSGIAGEMQLLGPSEAGAARRGCVGAKVEKDGVWGGDVRTPRHRTIRCKMAGEWLRQVRSRYARPWPAEAHAAPAHCLLQPSLSPPASVSLLLPLVLHALLEAALLGAGLVPMNSLSYLSRQFDVLASPRTPPSTPTTEHSSFALNGDRSTRLKRSGSTKSFLVPQPSSASGTCSLKRSYSSPAEVNPGLLASASSLLAPAISRKPSRPALRRPSTSSTEKAIRPKAGEASPAFRHFVFVRIILQLWHAFLATVRSLTRQPTAPPVADDVAVEDNSDEEEKDTEDESRDEKLPPPSVLLDSSPQHPPYQPTVPSPLSKPQPDLSTGFAKPPPEKGPRMSTPLPPPDPKALAASTLTPPGTRSRSETPTPPTKQTPFHQQKTLVLDLDETLIHSTSRPIPYAGGSGLFGFGGRNKGAGYTVEVVLGGRSTLYHVYKRPFVDYFLRKVRRALRRCLPSLPQHTDRSSAPPGITMVHARYLHRLDAGICRSCNRLA